MQFLANLGAVVIRPRATMARILEAPPRAWTVWLLFVLATLSGIFGDFDAPTAGELMEQQQGVVTALVVAGVILGLLVVIPALFWFYAWVPYLIGRFLGGTGDIRGVRAALAWGLAPAIWAMLYRIPVALWLGSVSTVNMRDGNITFDPGRLAGGCGAALVIAVVELAVFVWCMVVMSNTVGEAHRFSAWHGLGTLVVAAIAPLVVILAAALSMM